MPKESVSKPEPERRHEAKQRRCLMCSDAFESAWPGERVCGLCKRTDVWSSPADLEIRL